MNIVEFFESFNITNPAIVNNSIDEVIDVLTKAFPKFSFNVERLDFISQRVHCYFTIGGFSEYQFTLKADKFDNCANKTIVHAVKLRTSGISPVTKRIATTEPSK